MDPVCHSLAGLTMGQAGLAAPHAAGAADAGAGGQRARHRRRHHVHHRRVDVLPARLDARADCDGRLAAGPHRAGAGLGSAGAAPALARGAAGAAGRGAVAGRARHAVASAARLHEQLRHPAADAVFGPVVLRRRALHRRPVALRHPRRRALCWPGCGAAAPTAARVRRGSRWRPPRLYIAAMFASGLWARQEVHAGLARAGRGEAPLHGHAGHRQPAAPRGAHRPRPSLREGLRRLRAGAAFPARRATAWRSAPTTHSARDAAATPHRPRSTCEWSRFPFFVVERTMTPPRVQLNDARYSGPDGHRRLVGRRWCPCPKCRRSSRRSRASRMTAMRRVIAFVVVAALSPPGPVRLGAWGFPAHRHVADRMIGLLPAELRPLFEARRAFIVERVVDPDLWRNVGLGRGAAQPLPRPGSRGLRRLSVRRVAARVPTRRCRSSGATMVHEQGLLPWRTAEFYGRLRASVRVAVAAVAVAVRPRRHRPLLALCCVTTWPTATCRCTPSRTTTVS